MRFKLLRQRFHEANQIASATRDRHRRDAPSHPRSADAVKMIEHLPVKSAVLSRRCPPWKNPSQIDPLGTPPRHGDVDHRAEEQEDHECEQAAFHESILRRCLAPPAAFGADFMIRVAYVIAAGHTQPALAADVSPQGERATDLAPGFSIA